MEIILLKDVEKLGAKGELANVSEGYARNFLFPRKLAEIATPGKIAAVRKIMEEKAAHERRVAERAEELRELLSKTVITASGCSARARIRTSQRPSTPRARSK